MLCISPNKKVSYVNFMDMLNSCRLFQFIKAPAFLISSEGVNHAMAFLYETESKQRKISQEIAKKSNLVIDTNNSFGCLDGFLPKQAFKTIKLETDKGIADVANFLQQQFFSYESVLPGLQSFLLYDLNGYLFLQMPVLYYSAEVENKINAILAIAEKASAN